MLDAIGRKWILVETVGVGQVEVEVAGKADTTVVVLEGGSAITMESWVDAADAVLMAWYPGHMGGTAIAEVIFGEVTNSNVFSKAKEVEEVLIT